MSTPQFPFRQIVDGGQAEPDPLTDLASEAYNAHLFADAEYLADDIRLRLRGYAQACLRMLMNVQR